METIYIIIYLLKKNCSENNLSKKVHNFLLFPIVKTLWPLEVLRNSAPTCLPTKYISIWWYALQTIFFFTIFKLKHFEHGIPVHCTFRSPTNPTLSPHHGIGVAMVNGSECHGKQRQGGKLDFN